MRSRWARSRAPVAIAAASALGVATLGGLVTQIGPWYYALKKPAFQPPDWLFGPAWTLIFALCAIAGVKAWNSARRPVQRRVLLALFGVNAALNVSWSLLFFRLQRPDWALAEVGFLWLSIAVLIGVLATWSKPAAWLLVPYLAWVSFASLLTWAIVDLNAPFGRV